MKVRSKYSTLFASLLVCTTLSMLTFFTGCSSSHSGSDASSSDTSGEDLDLGVSAPGGEQKNQPSASTDDLILGGPESSTDGGGDLGGGGGVGTPGILGFISPEKGVSVTTIQWDKPIAQDNPGADCELRAAKKKGTYLCVVKDAKNVAILTILEAGSAATHHISKIMLDGKGAATWKRWLKELQDNGYTYIKGKKRGPRSTLISGDHKSRADVIWVAPKKAVTVILKPAGGSMAKGKVKGKRKGKR